MGARGSKLQELLGKIPDTVLAKRYGVGEDTIYRQRRRLGVPPARPRPAKVIRSRALRPLLSLTPREAAQETGVGKSTLSRLRGELKVPVPPRRSAWSPRALARLGKVPDEVLAAELGLKRSTVQVKRLEMGIRKRTVHRWTKEEDRLVRRLSADQAAQRLGRTRKAVVHRRARLGLSAP